MHLHTGVTRWACAPDCDLERARCCEVEPFGADVYKTPCLLKMQLVSCGSVRFCITSAHVLSTSPEKLGLMRLGTVISRMGFYLRALWRLQESILLSLFDVFSVLSFPLECITISGGLVVYSSVFLHQAGVFSFPQPHEVLMPWENVTRAASSFPPHTSLAFWLDWVWAS